MLSYIRSYVTATAFGKKQLLQNTVTGHIIIFHNKKLNISRQNFLLNFLYTWNRKSYNLLNMLIKGLSINKDFFNHRVQHKKQML